MLLGWSQSLSGLQGHLCSLIAVMLDYYWRKCDEIYGNYLDHRYNEKQNTVYFKEQQKM